MSLRARISVGFDEHANVTDRGRHFIVNVKVALGDLNLSSRASANPGVFELLKEIKSLLATSPAIKEALINDDQCRSSWNAIIRRFFQATPTLYPALMDATRYWNILEDLDVGRW